MQDVLDYLENDELLPQPAGSRDTVRERIEEAYTRVAKTMLTLPEEVQNTFKQSLEETEESLELLAKKEVRIS